MPFNRFRTPDGKQVDTVLGPEMKSTGEVMGLDADFGTAFAKSQAAAYGSLPHRRAGSSCRMANRDKRTMIFPIKVLADLGFEILATQGTAEVLRRNGVAGDRRAQALRGAGPNGESDHRPADPRRRDRPGRQHPARLDQRRRRRGSTATRSAPRRSWPTSRASPPCRGSAPRCRGSRRPSAGAIGVRSLQDWVASEMTDGTTRLFDHVLHPHRPREGAPLGVPGDPGGPSGPGARARAGSAAPVAGAWG